MLARPGWAGAGVAPEAWWPRAVFYRVDPLRFQDGDSDGKGDLSGILKRLDYLQSLGVDALLLDSVPAETAGQADLGDLVREASRHQLRVLVTVTPDLPGSSQQALMQTAHSWLAAGAAGLWLPRTSSLMSAGSDYPALIASMRAMVQSFPGERVLLTDPTPVNLDLAARPVHIGRRIDPGSFHAGRDRQLVTAALFAVHRTDLPQLRASLNAASQDPAPGVYDLLQFAQPPATGSPNAAADAALLLASRGAVVLDFGAEIGLDMYPAAPESGASRTALPVMQWTPSNHTPAVVERATPVPAAPGTETQFGAYHPYVPPPRSLTGAPGSRRVTVVPDLNVPEDLPDPDSLPGFTAGDLPATGAPQDPGRNVISEDRDPHSLLNTYRALIALHHGNATLRNGAQAVLNHDGEGVLAWVRHAPAGSRTVFSVLAVANLSDQPATLSLDADLAAQGMRSGALRPLFSSVPAATTGETTGHFLLPPHAAYLGEVSGRGMGAEPVISGRRSRRHRSRR